jgi:hypothetical protein
VSHAVVGADWIVVAVVGSALAAEVNVVEVAVTVQPAPEPVASLVSTVSGVVIDWVVSFSVAVGKLIVAAGALLMNASLPPLNVTDARVVARDPSGSATTAAVASVEAAASGNRRLLMCPWLLLESLSCCL